MPAPAKRTLPLPGTDNPLEIHFGDDNRPRTDRSTERTQFADCTEFTQPTESTASIESIFSHTNIVRRLNAIQLETAHRADVITQIKKDGGFEGYLNKTIQLQGKANLLFELAEQAKAAEAQQR